MTQLLDASTRVDREPPACDLGIARPHRSHSTLAVFLAACSVYLVAAWQLAIVNRAIVGDAMARVANGSYVLFSRDQHLAAVGFVWNPLPSFAALPLLSLSSWFPALRTQGFAGNIVSAVFMAGAVALVWRILRELHVAPPAALGLTVLFGIHPMVMQYGANGDSEATLVFFLSLTCLGLLRWLDRRDLRSLVLTGFALGLGYLSRQEFLAAGAASLMVILTVTYLDERGTRRHRRWTAVTEATLAGMPFVFSIVCWAGSALIIVGTATSYLQVNNEQVSGARLGIASVVGGTGVTDRLGYYLGQLLLLEPLWSVVVLGAAIVAIRHRDRRILAPLVTFGAVAAAQGTLFGTGSTFGWFRFAITVVPLTIVCGGLLVAKRPSRTPPSTRHCFATPTTVFLTASVLVACAVAIPSAANGMGTPRWGREEAASVHLLPGFGWAPTGASAYPPHWLDEYDRVASDLDRLHLRDGSILTDVQYTFPLILKSDRPHLFVIPSDHDFEPSVADPATYGVRYLLISNGSADVLRRSYPIADHGRNAHIAIGHRIRSYRAGPQTLWLFKVTRSVTGDRSAAQPR